MSVFLLSTWSIFWAEKFRGSFLDFFTIRTFLLEHSFIIKIVGGNELATLLEDYPMSLFLLSTWFILWAGWVEGIILFFFFTINRFFLEHSFMWLEFIGGWVVVVGLGLRGLGHGIRTKG